MHDIAQMLRLAAGGVPGQTSRTVGGTAAADIAPAATYTTAALSIGAAAADRFVVAAITSMTGSASPTTTAVTIGGVSATKLVAYNAGGRFEAALWGALVPTGTTAAVVVTTDINIDGYAVVLEAVYGAIPTPAYTVTASGGTGAITGVRNGLVITTLPQTGAYYSGAMTVDANPNSGSPNYTGCQTAVALPTSTASISPLSSGTGGYPYVAASFAPI